ncbi:MAG: hypothetical protein RBT63_00440 [Bdellovibrionales bacterium]|jgi:hypothetical protein|nr:hypothetical protein [Bdellovibrionales bacterium]
MFSGCVTVKKKSIEPEWVPHIYRYRATEGRCTFYRAAAKHELDCNDPTIYDYALIPVEQLDSVFNKFDRCEDWK